MSNFKISVCTVSMNRLHHIRQTLPVNIKENISYPNVEFVLLDYNSSDGLEEWVRFNLMNYIKSGVLKYFRAPDQTYFQPSHSRNMATRLASGEIFCMMDADNYCGEDYIHWINSAFVRKGKNSVVAAFFRREGLLYSDTGGKLSFHRDLFAKARGYDESFVDYGMEDRDLTERLIKAGGVKVPLENDAFMKFIKHSALDRIRNCHLINNLDGIYLDAVSYSNGDETKALYFLKDKTFHECNFQYQESLDDEWEFTFGGWYMEKDGYHTGTYLETSDGYRLISDRSAFFRRQSAEEIVSGAGGDRLTLTKVDAETEYYTLAIKGYSECINRIKYMENSEETRVINPAGWGLGRAFLNFDYEKPFEPGIDPGI